MIRKLMILSVIISIFMYIFSTPTFANDDLEHEHNFKDGFCTICNKQHKCTYVSPNYSIPGICDCGMSVEDYKVQINNTNLDFWIGDIVNDVTIYEKDYIIEPNGWLRHKNYIDIIDSNNNETEPTIRREHILDVYIENSIVKCITIYDPNIYIDELSLNSSIREFRTWAEKNNMVFTVNGSPTAELGQYIISKNDDCLLLYYNEDVWFSHYFHEHVWNSATCTQPIRCLCGETNGDALGHTVVVDAAIEPTCTTIGKTEGKHCSVCYEVLVTQENIEMLRHVYIEGKCNCGKRDPYYTLPVDHDHVYKNGFCNLCGKRHACNFAGATSHNPGICHCGYSEADYILEKHDTNLDLWIYERVSIGYELLESFTENFNMIRGNESDAWFISKRYGELLFDAQGQIIVPEKSVKYYVRMYPTINKHVGKIVITDPNVYIDNISLNSSFEEFKSWAAQNGLMIRQENVEEVFAKSGHYSVCFSKEQIFIEYDVGYHEEEELTIHGTYYDDNKKNIDIVACLILLIIVAFSVFLYVCYCAKKDDKVKN